MLSTRLAGGATLISSCPPSVVLDGMGFILPCGGVVVNTGGRNVAVSAQVAPVPGQTLPAMIPAPVRALLKPTQNVTLPPPGAGAQWVVEVAARRTLEEIGLATLGGAALVLGLAGVGVVDIGRHVFGRRKRRR